MSSDPQYARDPSSLTSIVQQFEEEGFTGQFSVREGGILLCTRCHQERAASQFSMSALRRTEGASDPADMAAVVGLTCPNCDNRGTLVLKYGPEAGVDESEVLLALEDDRAGGGVIVHPEESPDTMTSSQTDPAKPTSP